MDDAENKAVRVARRSTTEFVRDIAPIPHTVLLRELANGLWIAPNHADFGPLKILEVLRDEEHWNLLIEGQWKLRLVVNDSYELVRSQRVD